MRCNTKTTQQTVALFAALAIFSSVPCLGQVVQLPTYRQTTFSGTVSAPDAGTMSLGGVRYNQTGSLRRGWGPYSGRGSGGNLGGRSLSMRAVIIDLAAMDAAIMEGVNSGTSEASQYVVAPRQRRYVSGHRIGPGAGVSRRDPQAYRKALAGHANTIVTSQNPSLVESDVRYYIQRGQAAERAGSVQAARTYYRMAVAAMTPEMRERYQRAAAAKDAEGADATEKKDATAKQPGKTGSQAGDTHQRLRF